MISRVTEIEPGVKSLVKDNHKRGRILPTKTPLPGIVGTAPFPIPPASMQR
jgi:hypothetical protein